MTNICKKFRQLHEAPGLFLIPNPWDIGSARILEGFGFKALATTSGGMAYALGKPDGSVSREEALAHCRDIVSATSLPVSADLEKGFGNTPEAVYETVIMAAETGIAGCSIEDYTGNPDAPIFEFNLAVERIQAASEACRYLDNELVLTGRCESLVWGGNDLDAVIGRLQAYGKAGADVLFAPGLNRFDDVSRLMAEMDKPVNVIMSEPNLSFGIKELSDVGVKRISVGSSLAQVAYGGFVAALRELSERGTFDFAKKAIDYQELEALFPQN